MQMFIDLIIKGGPVMIPIIALSIIGLALILERTWTLWKIRLNFQPFAQEIFLFWGRGQFQKALERCDKVRHPIAEVFRLGILNRTVKREELEAVTEPIVINITSQNEIFLKEKPKTLSDLRTGIQTLIAFNKMRPVIVLADKSVIFDRVVQVFDVAKNVGVERLGIAIEEKPPK